MQQIEYYTRIRAKIAGPFSLEELRAMRSRGKLGRFHEVSEDKRNWVSAETLNSVFVPADGTNAVVDGPGTPAPGRLCRTRNTAEKRFETEPSAGDHAWHYVNKESEKEGPVSFDVLVAVARSGGINPETLVWSPDLPTWIRAGQIGGLVFHEHAARSAIGSVRTSKCAIASMVLSITCFAGIGSILSIMFGLKALRDIRASGGHLRGEGLARTGITISTAFLGLLLLSLAVALSR